MSIMSKKVAAVLRALPRDETVYYSANPGNAGDALIATGTFHLFEELRLNYEIIDINSFDLSEKIIVYAGGGNLNHIYSDARRFLQANHKNAKKVILLPHTITSNEDLISEFGSNCVIFARELVSLEHISKHASKCEVYIDHDMALNMDIKKLLTTAYPGTLSLITRKLLNKVLVRAADDRIPSMKTLFKSRQFERRSLGKRRNDTGAFFRQDVEAFGSELPENNADLSVIYEYGTRNKAYTDYTAWRLLTYIDHFRYVKTDRLHICVAAAMLGKEVEFYPNSYFKCQAVYEYSLRKAFPNIGWKG